MRISYFLTHGHNYIQEVGGLLDRHHENLVSNNVRTRLGSYSMFENSSLPALKLSTVDNGRYRRPTGPLRRYAKLAHPDANCLPLCMCLCSPLFRTCALIKATLEQSIQVGYTSERHRKG